MENKDKRIEIRMDKKQYDKIKEDANEKGMNLSEYIREMCLQGTSITECPKCWCKIMQKFQETEEKMESETDKNILRKMGQELWRV